MLLYADVVLARYLGEILEGRKCTITIVAACKRSPEHYLLRLATGAWSRLSHETRVLVGVSAEHCPRRCGIYPRHVTCCSQYSPLDNAEEVS